MNSPTNNPAFYFPPGKGIYEIRPGLFSLQSDFGNGVADRQIFQIDRQFHTYHDNKCKARNESAEKYICRMPGKDFSIINFFIQSTLLNAYPDYFSVNKQTRQLDCHLTSEQLDLHGKAGLDELAMQVQEDLAVMEVNDKGEGVIIALHLCAPNHWAAQDKLGKDFIETHQPVPGMERIYQRHREINKACLGKGPFVRFAWGLSTDTYLNHHPLPPVDIPVEEWCGRQFNPDKPELFMRVERQTLHGFKTEQLLLFTIRTYFYDVTTLSLQHRQLLLKTIRSMHDEALIYKGISGSKQDICQWLEESL